MKHGLLILCFHEGSGDNTFVNITSGREKPSSGKGNTRMTSEEMWIA